MFFENRSKLADIYSVGNNNKKGFFVKRENKRRFENVKK